MRLTRQAALAIALIAGLLAALFAWMFIGQQNKPKAKAPETVQIPVPIATIKAGTELQAAMFQLGEQPKEQLTPNIVTDAQTLQGRVAVMELPGGQPVRVEQIRERDVRLGMAWALNPGLRGMAVSLDVVGTVGDFIKPLDHVDVLTAFRQDNQAVVRTLVQDVVVLAIGQTITSAPPATTTEETGETTKEAPPPRKTETPVTLALTPAQAQLILTADQAGDLRLTLRGKGDRSVLPLAPANSWSMVGQVPKPGATPTTTQGAPSASAASPQPPAATAPAPAPAPVRTAGAGQAPQAGPKLPKQPYVEVVRGSAREIVVP
ncbi:Flp pilus assembly protein CpaB [bacterium]|nr:Flp pilus assembly protein CpaB [bacterium]